VGDAIDPLEKARREVGLSVSELWWRYFAIGGMSNELEVEAILYQALVPTESDRDLLAVALNERISELGGDHPIPYSNDDQQSR
jgi:hypothetical protein